MFRHYSLANVCYAYLADVPTIDAAVLTHETAVFRGSRWHKRGWTLQQLLAPAVLFFVSGSWEVLGAKAKLSDILERITRVPAGILSHQEEFCDASVAQRMSWAAGHETTRPEDEAYCLMCLLGVNMPTLYGKGRRAFRRLQQEIINNALIRRSLRGVTRHRRYCRTFSESSHLSSVAVILAMIITMSTLVSWRTHHQISPARQELGVP